MTSARADDWDKWTVALVSPSGDEERTVEVWAGSGYDAQEKGRDEAKKIWGTRKVKIVSVRERRAYSDDCLAAANDALDKLGARLDVLERKRT